MPKFITITVPVKVKVNVDEYVKEFTHLEAPPCKEELQWELDIDVRQAVKNSYTYTSHVYEVQD